MKYPQRFNLVDRGNGLICKVTYDAESGMYLQDYHDGERPAKRTEKDIDELIYYSYDISHEYPNQFSFTHDTTSQMYDLVKIPNTRLWGCTFHGDTFGVGVTGATYTAEEIAHHFKEGHWKEIAPEVAPRSEVSNAEPVERPLVFPFTFRVSDQKSVCTAHGLNCDSNLVTSGDEFGFKYPTCWTEGMARQAIKDGDWIVLSVGPQTTTAPPEPSKEAAKALDSLVIKVSSDGVVEATEQILKLAEATERLNIAMESLATIFEDTRELLLGVSRHCEAEDNQCQHFDFSSFIKCD